jgi:hypothetical protein
MVFKDEIRNTERVLPPVRTEVMISDAKVAKKCTNITENMYPVR